MTIGPKADLTDSAILGTAVWRESVMEYHSPMTPQVEVPQPVLRPAK